MSTIKSCIAIIERNEKDYIVNALDSILISSNTVPNTLSRIFVIDGGSTDGTIETIKKKFSTSNIQLLFDNSQGLGAAHDFAIKKLEMCDIIFFTFGDEIVTKNWISSAIEWFRKSDVGAVFGPVYIYNPKTIMERYADWKLKRYFSRLHRGQHIPYAAATNLAIKRNVALEIGGFREDLIDADDSEFTYRVTKSGYKVVYEPDMVVFHQKAEEANLKTLIRATMLVAFGYGQVAFIHGLDWHPICKLYTLILPSILFWLPVILFNPLIGLFIAISITSTELIYFIYQASRARSFIPLIGILVEPLRLVFASLSFYLGYLYQHGLNKNKKFAFFIKKTFDYIRLHIGH